MGQVRNKTLSRTKSEQNHKSANFVAEARLHEKLSRPGLNSRTVKKPDILLSVTFNTGVKMLYTTYLYHCEICLERCMRPRSQPSCCSDVGCTAIVSLCTPSLKWNLFLWPYVRTHTDTSNIWYLLSVFISFVCSAAVVSMAGSSGPLANMCFTHGWHMSVVRCFTCEVLSISRDKSAQSAALLLTMVSILYLAGVCLNPLILDSHRTHT